MRASERYLQYVSLPLAPVSSIILLLAVFARQSHKRHRLLAGWEAGRKSDNRNMRFILG